MDEILIRILLFAFGVILGMEVGHMIARKQLLSLLSGWVEEMRKIGGKQHETNADQRGA